jgi:hypothetical protein
MGPFIGAEGGDVDAEVILVARMVPTSMPMPMVS